MMKAETLFKITIYPAELGNLPTSLPAKASEKNQIQEMIIQAKVNPIFSRLVYDNELVPITPIVSMIA